MRSVGRNLGMDFLPGALNFDPLAFPADPLFAGRVAWFDALIGNVDRSWRNPNLMQWHGRTYLIDHGASLIFQHSWPRDAQALAKSARRPARLEDHALARFAPDLAAADAALAPLVTPEAVAAAAALVPDEWLADEPGFAGPDDVRRGFGDWFAARLRAPRSEWLPELGR